MKRKSRKLFVFFVYFVIFIFILSIWASFVVYFFPAKTSSNDYQWNLNVEVNKNNLNNTGINNWMYKYFSWLNLTGVNFTWENK